MPCNNCKATLELIESNGGTKEGQFSEHYQCVQCGAQGRIYGEASDPPHQWNKTGCCA